MADSLRADIVRRQVLMAVETRGNLAMTALLVAMDMRGLMV
jgi:hypothetical protein